MVKNDLKQYETVFNGMKEFYAPIQENILETLKRAGFGVITVKENGDNGEYLIKQLSWNMNETEVLETVKGVFNTFEFDLIESRDNFNIYTYCKKLNKDIYKIVFSNENKDINIFNENNIYYNSY